jgi:hypothetical protein
LAAILFCIIAGVLAPGVDAMYNEMGYVKLLLPTIVWTLACHLFIPQIKRPDMPVVWAQTDHDGDLGGDRHITGI